MAPELLCIAARLDEYWGELPDEWTEAATMSPDFSLERLRNVLARFDTVRSLFRRGDAMNETTI